MKSLVSLASQEHVRINEIKICRHKGKRCHRTYISSRKNQRMCIPCGCDMGKDLELKKVDKKKHWKTGTNKK